MNLSYDLVRHGLAFPAVGAPNYRYGEMLIVASIDAQQQRKGFWDPAYQSTRKLAVTTF